MSRRNNGKNGGFGRDEMTALLGGADLQEHLTRNSGGKPTSSSKSQKPSSFSSSDPIDVSNLTAAQTAALLKQRDQEKYGNSTGSGGGGVGIKRLRAVKASRHSELASLLIEQQQIQQQQQQQGQQQQQQEETTNSNEFVRKSKQRSKAKPKIVVVRQKPKPQILQSKRRRLDDEHDDHDDDGDYDHHTTTTTDDTQQQRRKINNSSSSSSSSSEDENEQESRRRQRQNDSDDSSSSEEDDRRSRILAKRRQQQQQRQHVEEEEEASQKPEIMTENKETPKPEAQPRKSNEQEPVRTMRRAPQPDSSSSSSSPSSSSPSSSDSDSGSDSSDEEPQRAKPLFVPKHKRGMIQSQQQKEQEATEKEERQKQRDQQRRLQSRMMVAQVVSADAQHNSGRAGLENEDDDEVGGATNPMPNDEDPDSIEDQERERDAWEIRELRRLFQQQDLLETREQERIEYERRRQMTDEERLLEDEALGIFQKPGQRRSHNSSKDEKRSLHQRYFHRGAFYMDKEEWSENDVRHKAKEYEQAATAEDKIDKSQLPKIMQTKGKFGFARQNTKYKGLAHEDTTDKSLDFLPIVQKTKKKHPPPRN